MDPEIPTGQKLGNLLVWVSAAGSSRNKENKRTKIFRAAPSQASQPGPIANDPSYRSKSEVPGQHFGCQRRGQGPQEGVGNEWKGRQRE